MQTVQVVPVTDEASARRRIAECTAHLIEQKQFYGYLLQQFDIKHNPQLPASMGVRYVKERSRIELSFNPQFMVQPKTLPWVFGVTETEPWTFDNFVAVLEHECLHVVLRHLVRHKRGNAIEATLWNIAEDMVINQQLQNIPRGCVTLDWQGVQYPPNLPAEGYYELLKQSMPKCPVHNPKDGKGGKDAKGKKSSGKGQKDKSNKGETEGQTGEKQEADGNQGQNGQGESGDPQAGQDGQGQSPGQNQGSEPGNGHGPGGSTPCPYCSGQTLDSHEGFGEAADRMAEEAMRQAVGRAKQQYERQRRKNDGTRSQGTLPDQVERWIEQLLHRPINWRHRLRCIGNSAVKYGWRSTIHRPHRRYGTMFAGRKPAHAGKVLVAVDTSGSVSDKLLAAFWHEVRNITRRCEVILVECDAAVHDVKSVKGRKVPGLKGGGGSNFSGVFDLVLGKGDYDRKWKALAHEPAALIFLTDGAIAVPDKNLTGVDVYWCIPDNCNPPTTTYGEVIKMNADDMIG